MKKFDYYIGIDVSLLTGVQCSVKYKFRLSAVALLQILPLLYHLKTCCAFRELLKKDCSFDNNVVSLISNQLIKYDEQSDTKLRNNS